MHNGDSFATPSYGTTPPTPPTSRMQTVALQYLGDCRFCATACIESIQICLGTTCVAACVISIVVMAIAGACQLYPDHCNTSD